MSDKSSFVNQVFSSVASRYDLMNNLMSLGLHHSWKNEAILQLEISPSSTVLDLACGTADLSILIAKELNHEGQLVCCDVNPDMLRVGQDQFHDTIAPSCQTHFVLGNGQALPFADNSFDRLIIGFGLRNFNDIQQGLKEFYRTLKPRGMLLVLEFSKPQHPLLGDAYKAYSNHIIPNLGQWIANDRESYQYLVDSIQQHPDQNTLQKMIEDEGFNSCSYQNILGGIVAIHKGFKP